MADKLKKIKNTATEKTTPVGDTVLPTAEKTQKKTGLTPNKKSPEKQAYEEELTNNITSLLKANPNGLTVDELRTNLFDTVSETELDKTNKQLRSFCRALHCKVTPIENSRKVRYSLQ